MVRKQILGASWVARSVKCQALDFSSGRDLTVHEFKSHLRLHAGTTEPAWDSLSPSLCSSPTLSKKINIKKNRKQILYDLSLLKHTEIYSLPYVKFWQMLPVYLKNKVFFCFGGFFLQFWGAVFHIHQIGH